MNLRRKTRGELQVLQVQAENALLAHATPPAARARARAVRLRVIAELARRDSAIVARTRQERTK